jgi:gas vesicle protein
VKETQSQESFSVKKTSFSGRMNQIDRILLSGFIFGGDYLHTLLMAQDHLPSPMMPCDLLEYPPARSLVIALLSKPEDSQQLRTEPKVFLSHFFQEQGDAEVRSVVSEALLWESPPWSLEDFKRAVSKSLARNWARFSQRVKLALVEAETKQDASLQSQLMKDYLDVQRKMKDFKNFYDEE